MKYLFYWTLLVIISQELSAQKPPLDTSVINKWPSIGGCGISRDEKYIWHSIDNQPAGSHTLLIQALDSSWKLKIADVSECDFTRDSRQAVFAKPGDTLCLLILGDTAYDHIPHVNGHKLLQNDAEQWLVYQVDTLERELVIRDMGSGKERRFFFVSDYFFQENGSAVLLQSSSQQDSGIVLKWVNLFNSKEQIIWKGKKASNFIFSNRGDQLAFIGEERRNKGGKAIYYYKSKIDKTVLLADGYSLELNKSWEINSLQGFSQDNSKLFFTVQHTREQFTPQPDAVMVDIWNYKDLQLQSEQTAGSDPNELFGYKHTATIQLSDQKIQRLDQDNERVLEIKGDWALIEHNDGEPLMTEQYSYPVAKRSVFLMSIKNGTRKVIAENTRLGFSFSQEGKYLLYYDPIKKNYFTYEILTGNHRNITQSIHTIWTEINIDLGDSAGYAKEPIGWLTDDRAVLLCERYDIWQVDPSGNAPPTKLTNGYGRRNNIEFRSVKIYRDGPIDQQGKLLLTAVDWSNQDRGFYTKTIGTPGNPKRLTMGSYVYEYQEGVTDFLEGSMHAQTYLIKRMSAKESPNFFFTRDFKTFNSISAVHPEANYNWLTTTLWNWKLPDGRTCQGILYKPEDFDPRKKYPVILFYYEKVSNRLNQYPYPGLTHGDINIPWYVSHGYLVFTPDIHYKIGYPGESALQSIISAANALSAMPWVDVHRMGIAGHSFGGYETNYIVTHTSIFAAAMAGSGSADLISFYGGESNKSGSSYQGAFEFAGQFRIGGTLWQKPDLYIKNSPIFKADKVTTPILLMNNKGDGSTPFAQGVEFFTALRRLGKKVWMLQYDGAGHTLDGKAAVDFTIREAQFFDHYLKGYPAPIWMTKGIPARLKGIETGFGLDEKTRNTNTAL